MNDTKVAIKIMKPFQDSEQVTAQEQQEAFLREISIMKKIDNTHCLKFFDCFEYDHSYYVVTECLYGKELFSCILDQEGKFYQEPKAIPIIQQILTALSYLHSHYICHCDIKPENLKFTDDTQSLIKIIDFGEATSFESGPMVDWVGTANYMAPEIISGLKYGPGIDLWSLGVVVYVMLSGTFPFESESEEELFELIRAKDFEFYSPHWDRVSFLAKDFISQLLTDSKARLTSKRALKHAWLCQPRAL
uniref:Protein kinase domain-containing protein n=1 Tax=Arcella intermedia TaxID=1963864 RepID=A0A6B2LDF1_9EUKA